MSNLKDDFIKTLVAELAKALAKPAANFLASFGQWSIEKVTLVPGAVTQFVEWWNGKTIAIIGATASGKNSFYDCLLDREPPKEHIQTRGVEKVDSFTFRRNVQSLGAIELRCKRSVNVGGEEDERIRHWAKACRNADFIFYLVDMERFTDPILLESYQKRIRKDLQWLGANLSKFKAGVKVHLLLNKIDKVVQIPSHVDNRNAFIVTELSRHLEEMDKMARSTFDNNSRALSGISPMCMVDSELFNSLFDGVLVHIYRQEHQN